jgi:hypothetical protein
MKMTKLISALTLGAFAVPAFAFNQIPTPGTMSLVGVAAVAAIVVALRKKK